MDPDTNESDAYLSEETYQIIGFSMKLHSSIGHGFHEKVYENGLVIEFKQQPAFKIEYEGEHLTEFRPDLIAHGKIIIDTKAIDKITDRERGQMINYLKVTKLYLGLLINFKHPKLEFERVIL